MKAKGSYKPTKWEFETLNNGQTALIRFYENIKKVEDEEAGTYYEFDRYTIRRPFDAGLKSRIETGVAAWLALAKSEEAVALSAEVRAERDRLLAETDWTQALDTPISGASREELRSYRQALRDISGAEAFPYDVTWPEKPDIEKADPDPVDAAFDILVGGENDA